MEATADFLADIFGPVSEGMVFLSSLPNDDAPESEPRERRVMTRSPDIIKRFCAKWDRPHRGLFYCVATVKPGSDTRSKETITEIVCVHCDVDSKDVDMSVDEIVERLRSLFVPPSIIVRSGHGVHAYWLLREGIPVDSDSIERVEAVLKQFLGILAADPKPAHSAALMRLPGTHNTKHGEWTEVVVVEANMVRHEFDDIVEWLDWQGPIIRPKLSSAVAAKPQETNPFLIVAERFGYKPPIDIEQRLSIMSYQGTGDASIHQTQIQVSASLLSRGEDMEEVVAILMEATRAAAAQHGERWNWTREERNIRRMCADWVRKNPPPPKIVAKNDAPAADEEDLDETVANGTTGGNVVSMASARAAKKPGKNDKTPAHVVLGTAVIETMQNRGETLLVTSGQIWRYADGLWSCPMLEGRRWLEVEIETGARALRLASTNKLISETRQWILRHPDLFRDEIEWDAHGKIPTRSGLLDPRTLTLEAPRADHFATWRVECDYEPTARCPWWIRMLSDFFADRPEGDRDNTIQVLQEIVGAALLEDKPRALTRALVLEGASETGKTRVLEVCSGLLSQQPISTPFEALGGSHGLMEFTRRAPWVLNEAFDQGRWHLTSVVKSILTGDPVQINIKNGPLITQRVRCPVFWGTNHPPQFKEATKAIVNRMIILQCRTVFSSKVPVGTAAEARRHGFSEPSEFVLAMEMPGLLNWAIRGLRRALERGFFETTAEIDRTLETVREDSNIVAGFLKECVDYDPDKMISTPDFCAAFSVWWQENKGEDRNTPSNDSIGRAMAAFGDARIGLDKLEIRDNRQRYYGGIGLNLIGLDYWAGASQEGLAKGKTARISADRIDVNRTIPATWADRTSIKRLRAAFPTGPSPGDTSRDTSDHFAEVSERSVIDTSPRF